MKIYKVTGKSVKLAVASLVRLTAAQAAVRMHNLTLVEGPGCDDRSTYSVVNPIQFKANEVFWYNGDINKGLSVELEVLAVLQDEWDSSMKVEDIKNFAAMLPGFELDPALKKKDEIVKAVERFLAGQEEDSGADWDPDNMDVNQMHEFAFKNNLAVDLDLEDHAELQAAIEEQLTKAE